MILVMYIYLDSLQTLLTISPRNMNWKKPKTTTTPLNHGRSRIFSQNYEWLKYKHTSEKIKNENQSTSLSPWCFDKNVWKHEVNYHPMHVRKIIFFHRCKWQLFSFFKFYNVFRIVRFFSSLCIFDKKYAFFYGQYVTY